jgi:hypothetical protein
MYVVACVQTASMEFFEKKDLVPVMCCGVFCVGECCMQNYNSTFCFINMWNLASHPNGYTGPEGVAEQGLKVLHNRA